MPMRTLRCSRRYRGIHSSVSATMAQGNEFNKPFCVLVAPNPFTTVGNQ